MIASGLLGGLLYASATAGQPVEVAPRGDIRGLFTSEDYPSMALRHQEQGGVRARLHVGPDGRVTQCKIAESSGSEHLDRATCTVLRARARFEPALDEAGQPTSGIYVTPTVEWRISRPPVDAFPVEAARTIPTPLLFGFTAKGALRRCGQLAPGDAAPQPCDREQEQHALMIGMQIVDHPLYSQGDWLVGSLWGDREQVLRWHDRVGRAASDVLHLSKVLTEMHECFETPEGEQVCVTGRRLRVPDGAAGDNALELFAVVPVGRAAGLID